MLLYFTIIIYIMLLIVCIDKNKYKIKYLIDNKEYFHIIFCIFELRPLLLCYVLNKIHETNMKILYVIFIISYINIIRSFDNKLNITFYSIIERNRIY